MPAFPLHSIANLSRIPLNGLSLDHSAGRGPWGRRISHALSQDPSPYLSQSQ